MSIENAYLDKALITCGAPQGLILGPLLFLLYISDMPQAADSEFLLYTDDICLIFQYKDIIAMEEYLNRDFLTFIDTAQKTKFSMKHFW